MAKIIYDASKQKGTKVWILIVFLSSYDKYISNNVEMSAEWFLFELKLLANFRKISNFATFIEQKVQCMMISFNKALFM